MTDHYQATCLNCGVPLEGKFCHECGQKKVEPSERTFKYFVIQFFGSAFFLENNFVRNVWTLLSRPGRLTLDYIEGRRKRWMTPFSLFLLINLFYFWYTPFSDLNQTLYEHMNIAVHKNIATHLVDRKLDREKITLEEYADTYNKKSSSYANSLIILQIPLFAILMAGLFYRNKYFFADHFIFSLHLFAFLLLEALIIAVVLAINSGVVAFMNETVFNVFKALMALIFIAYTWFALRQVYKRKWWTTTLYLPLVVFVFVFTQMVYRTVLFLIIYTVT